MLQDVRIAEQQNIKKPGGYDHIKQLSIQPHTGIFFNNTCIMKKGYVGGLYT